MSAQVVAMAFIRVKKRGDRRYAHLVESVWDPDKGAPRQRVLKYLGSADAVHPEDVPPEHRHEPAVAPWLKRHAREADAAYREDVAAYRAELRDALLRADRRAVDRVVRNAVDAYGTWAFLEEIATPLLHAVGEDWHAGRITVVDVAGSEIRLGGRIFDSSTSTW